MHVYYPPISSTTVSSLPPPQVVGHKEGLDVMERADPLFLLIGLPTIPVMLILGKMIRWEDYVLRFWRKYSNKLQIFNNIFPGEGEMSSFFYSTHRSHLSPGGLLLRAISDIGALANLLLARTLFLQHKAVEMR